MLIQLQVEPRHEHWIATKHILRYLRGMLNFGLRYASNNDVHLHGFTNLDWVWSVDDRNSTFGICFSLGSAMISCDRRKHKSVALNTAEAKYIVACDICTEAVWRCKIVSRIFD
jgi:hypothetical protein